MTLLNVVVAVLMDGMASEAAPVDEGEDSMDKVLKRVDSDIYSSHLASILTAYKADASLHQCLVNRCPTVCMSHH